MHSTSSSISHESTSTIIIGFPTYVPIEPIRPRPGKMKSFRFEYRNTGCARLGRPKDRSLQKKTSYSLCRWPDTSKVSAHIHTSEDDDRGIRASHPAGGSLMRRLTPDGLLCNNRQQHEWSE